MDGEASTNGNQFDSECADAFLHNPPDNTGSIEEQTELDKSISQIEAAEIVVFSKDNTCPILKDKCSYEGLEKVLLEHNVVSKKTSVSATNGNSDLNGKMTDGASLVLQDSKFTLATDKFIEDHNSSWSLFKVGEKPNTADQVKSDSFVPIEVLPSRGESDGDHCHVDPTSSDFAIDYRQCINQENTEQTKIEDTCSTIVAWSYGATESDKSNGVHKNLTNKSSKVLGEGCSTSTDIASDTTISNHSGTEGNPANVEVEIRLPNSTSESAVEATNSREESRGNKNSREFLQLQNNSVFEVTTVPDATTAPARSSFYNNNHGDLNSSGPIVTSGQTANSGSISMRSDSSTTSTRSFAFPILQTEWNTSPVKMAKAKKPRCWRMGLICCKF